MLRPLSQMERMLWKMAEHFQIFGTMTVRIAGTFSVDELRAALARVRLRQPWLGVRISSSDAFGACFQTTNVPDFVVRVVDPAAEDTWLTAAAQEHQLPFSFATGPLVRFALLRSAKFSDLVIIANHLLVDGTTLIYLIEEILQQLGDPEAAGPPSTAMPPLEDLLPPLSGRSLLRHHRQSLTPVRPLAASAQTGQLGVLSWLLTEAETASLCRRSGAEQTTVYAAICAAFLRAVADLEKSSPVRRIETPINLRGQLSQPMDRAWGNYFTLVETAIDCAKERNFWGLARAFKHQLSQQMEKEALFWRWRVTKYLMKVVPNATLGWLLRHTLLPFKIDYDLCITNLGRINIPVCYGPLRIEAIFAPTMSLGAANHRVLSVVTWGDRLAFSLTTFDLPLGNELKERAMHHLTQALH